MSADIHPDESQTTEVIELPKIAAFWRDFSNQLGELEALSEPAFVERGNEVLQKYAPGLSLEMEGKLKQAGSKLVISARGNTDQFESAQAIVRQAPHFDHYSVQAFRSRAQLDKGGNFGMRMDGFELTCADIRVGYFNAGGITGLKLSFEKSIAPDLLEHAQHMTFIMLDHVLGEWDFSVRVGPIEFVDQVPRDVTGDATEDVSGDALEGVHGTALLSDFPPIFDAFIRNQLGRTYAFPQEDADRWISLEVRAPDADEDAPPDTLIFHDGANAVATRADLPYFFEWRINFESQQELDGVRDAHDALDRQLSSQQCGILAFSRIEEMRSRVALYYVEDPESVMHLAQQFSQQHAPMHEPQMMVMFDPSWNEYLSLYTAIHRHDRREEVLAS